MRERSRALLPAACTPFILALGNGPVWGQESVAGLEEITVTATKREESVQDVAVAVTALSKDFVEKFRLYGPEDLQKYAPNVAFRDDTLAGQKGIVIRGVGTGTVSIGVEGSVGIVVDNVVLGKEGAGISGFADVERIEVLRGPQGTLFGKNASAGIVNVITKRPNMEAFEGYAKASYGNYDDYRIDAHVTGPLIRNFGFHLSAFAHDFDGYSDNVVTHSDANGGDEKGIRLKLLYEVTEDLEIQILGDYLEANHQCCEWSPRIVQPGTLHDVLVTGPGLAELGEHSRDTIQENRARDDVEQGGASAEINWSLGDYTLTSITAWRTWENFANIVPDLLPNIIQIIESGQDFRDQSQFTQEFRLASPDTDRFNYVLGLFYFDQEISIDAARRGFGFWGVIPGIGAVNFVPDTTALVSSVHASHDTLNMAAFGDATFHITEDLSLLLGLRYTREELSGKYDRFAEPGAIGTHPGFPPVSFVVDEFDDDEVTYRAGLQYNWSPDIMTYVTYGTGYKGAGINLDANQATGATAVVKPETVRNIEVGLKSRLLDDRLQLNVAAFSAVFEDYQGTAFDPLTVTFSLQSIKELKTDGLEVELVAAPTPNLQLFANAAYIDARYTDFTNAACYPGQTEAQGCMGGIQNLNGEPLPRTPEYTFTVGAEYAREIGGSLTGFINGAYAWRDRQHYGIDNDPNVFIDDYGLLDLSLGLRTRDDRYEVALWGKNVLDEDYASYVFGQLGGEGNYSHFMGAPATYGVSLTGRF